MVLACLSLSPYMKTAGEALFFLPRRRVRKYAVVRYTHVYMCVHASVNVFPLNGGFCCWSRKVVKKKLFSFHAGANRFIRRTLSLRICLLISFLSFSTFLSLVALLSWSSLLARSRGLRGIQHRNPVNAGNKIRMISHKRTKKEVLRECLPQVHEEVFQSFCRHIFSVVYKTANCAPPLLTVLALTSRPRNLRVKPRHSETEQEFCFLACRSIERTPSAEAVEVVERELASLERSLLCLLCPHVPSILASSILLRFVRGG